MELIIVNNKLLRNNFQNTGIGKLINSFKSHEEEEVVEASKQLVRKWKKLVEPPVEKCKVEKSKVEKCKVEKCKVEKKVEQPLLVYFYRPNIKKSS